MPPTPVLSSLVLAAACSLFGSVAGFGSVAPETESDTVRLERKMDGKYCAPYATPEMDNVVEAKGLMLTPGTLTSAHLDTAWAACLDVLPGTTNVEVKCSTNAGLTDVEPSCAVWCNAGCECLLNHDAPADTSTASSFAPDDVTLSDEYCCDKRPDATDDVTCVEGVPTGILSEKYFCIRQGDDVDCLTVYDSQLPQRCNDARFAGTTYTNTMALVESNEAFTISKANTTALPVRLLPPLRHSNRKTNSPGRRTKTCTRASPACHPRSRHRDVRRGS